MRPGRWLAAFAVATSAVCAAQTPAPFDSARAWEHLRQMVAIGPRPSGSTGIRFTRTYITRQLRTAGLTVQEQPFTDRKSTRLNSSHLKLSRMPSSA